MKKMNRAIEGSNIDWFFGWKLFSFERISGLHVPTVQESTPVDTEELANAVKEPVLDNDYKFTKILKKRRTAIKNTFYVFNLELVWDVNRIV